MNIEGLSEATLEKFVDEGMVREFADLFDMEKWRDRIITMVFSVRNRLKPAEVGRKANRRNPRACSSAWGYRT